MDEMKRMERGEPACRGAGGADRSSLPSCRGARGESCHPHGEREARGGSAGLKPGWELYNSDPHSPTGTVAAEGRYPETKNCIVRLRGYYRSETELLYPRKTACWKQQYKRKDTRRPQLRTALQVKCRLV